jgi:hypothetical protein
MLLRRAVPVQIRVPGTVLEIAVIHPRGADEQEANSLSYRTVSSKQSAHSIRASPDLPLLATLKFLTCLFHSSWGID